MKDAAIEEKPFWKVKSLDDLTETEWESLCDGCARCCLVKLEQEETGEILLTRLACKQLNIGACRCNDYPNRFSKMPDCGDLTPDNVREISWLPPTCGYRLVAEGRDLYWWHPLVSGSPETVHEAGISVRSFAMSEGRVKEDHYDRYIIADFEDE